MKLHLPFSRPGMPAGAADAMQDALELVRSGQLQRASARLVQGLASPSPAAPHPTTPRQAAPFARGGAQDAEDLRRSAGASAEATAEARGHFERVAFTLHGAPHPYHLYVPARAAQGGLRPLVLMLHGCTQNAEDFARGTGMNAAADSAGALVLYPTQSHAANAQGCWNWFRPQDQQAGSGEPALLVAMVRDAMRRHAVDPQRIYVAGLSAGGAMAALLAQEYPDMFAAAGVHSGLAAGAAQSMIGALSAMNSGAKGWAPPEAGGTRTVPMIVFHGQADATVHPRNGEQLWEGAVAGAGVGAQQVVENGRSADGRGYTRTVVLAPGEQVPHAEHWLLHGNGHAWSGGHASGSHTHPGGVDATREMLRFFLQRPEGSTRQAAA